MYELIVFLRKYIAGIKINFQNIFFYEDTPFNGKVRSTFGSIFTDKL